FLPAGVSPLRVGLLCWGLSPRSAACRRFIPSEIFLRASALILRLFLPALPSVGVIPALGRPPNCVRSSLISSSILARSASSPIKASSSSRCCSGNRYSIRQWQRGHCVDIQRTSRDCRCNFLPPLTLGG